MATSVGVSRDLSTPTASRPREATNHKAATWPLTRRVAWSSLRVVMTERQPPVEASELSACPECGHGLEVASQRHELLKDVGRSATRQVLEMSETVNKVTGPGFSVDYSEGRGQVLKAKKAALGKSRKPVQSKVFKVVVETPSAARSRREKK